MSLDEEIEEARKEIKTDAYAMSLGEIANLYRDKEIDIAPEFQRLFRWSTKQKSRFIESIFLGIPLPSIFVATRDDGTWEVVDGLQRLSTVLQFMDELRIAGEASDISIDGVDQTDETLVDDAQPLVLTKTKYLESLAGKTWAGTDALTPSQRLMIKRAKMDVKIIDKASSGDSKYELFQRLNTGGSPLSDQEVRNVLLLMQNRERFRWVNSLGQLPAFQNSLSLSDRLIAEGYDLELMFRFIAFTESSKEHLGEFDDLGEFLDGWAKNIAAFAESDLERFAALAEGTFTLISEAFEGEGFRRYAIDEHRFKGPFSVSAFEAISVGLGANLEGWRAARSSEGADWVKARLEARIEDLWSSPVFKQRARSGVRASGRVPWTVPLGREIFADIQ